MPHSLNIDDAAVERAAWLDGDACRSTGPRDVPCERFILPMARVIVDDGRLRIGEQVSCWYVRDTININTYRRLASFLRQRAETPRVRSYRDGDDAVASADLGTNSNGSS